MRMLAAALATGTLAACGSGADVARAPVYEGIETRLLDGNLVNFRVVMRGPADRTMVADYAACAAAQYALIRGYGFARHLRTSVTRDGPVWRGDAVFMVSPTLPRGMATIDAEVTVRDCGARGIPTI
jgi:hypothetical protein